MEIQGPREALIATHSFAGASPILEWAKLLSGFGPAGSYENPFANYCVGKVLAEQGPFETTGLIEVIREKMSTAYRLSSGGVQIEIILPEAFAAPIPPKYDALVLGDYVENAFFYDYLGHNEAKGRISRLVSAVKPGGAVYVFDFADEEEKYSFRKEGSFSEIYKELLSDCGCDTEGAWEYSRMEMNMDPLTHDTSPFVPCEEENEGNMVFARTVRKQI
jgi:hypothetical protein